jgi:hypothetical protein
MAAAPLSKRYSFLVHGLRRQSFVSCARAKRAWLRSCSEEAYPVQNPHPGDVAQEVRVSGTAGLRRPRHGGFESPSKVVSGRSQTDSTSIHPPHCRSASIAPDFPYQ